LGRPFPRVLSDMIRYHDVSVHCSCEDSKETIPLPDYAAMQLLPLFCDPWPINTTQYQYADLVYIEDCIAELAGRVSRLVGIVFLSTISGPKNTVIIVCKTGCIYNVQTFPSRATIFVGFSARTPSNERSASSIERVASCWMPEQRLFWTRK
jgi:hypothetical protein